jgi:serine/threonine protein kinase
MDPSGGDTLEQRLREPGLPFRASATRVLQVLCGVLQGLRHMHQHGWVLRDLSPRMLPCSSRSNFDFLCSLILMLLILYGMVYIGNVLIERVAAQWNAPSSEMPYIIDFGLARRLPGGGGPSSRGWVDPPDAKVQLNSPLMVLSHHHHPHITLILSCLFLMMTLIMRSHLKL